MIKRFKQIMLTVTTGAALLFPVMAPAVVHADDKLIQNGVCAGTSLQISSATPTACPAPDDSSSGSVNKLITKIINIFSSLVGIIAVIMIVYGGFKYITSGGNDGNVSAAKNTILYAIIGLVIVALAQIIVKYVLSSATSLG